MTLQDDVDVDDDYEDDDDKDYDEDEEYDEDDGGNYGAYLQTAALGEHVTLPCRVENKQGNLQWTRSVVSY